ncbi:MAG: GGDEF domain-containing protein [Intestinibacillus sp.]
MNEISGNSIIDEIQNEYRRIDNNWLKLHYKTFIVLVLFGFLVEIVLGTAWYVMGYIAIPLPIYVLKYIVAPLFCNFCLIVVGTWAMYSLRLAQLARAYIISLLFVGICFVFFSVHSIFHSLYLIFALPMMVTVVYGNYTLTTITSGASIIAKVLSELFVEWDPDKFYPLASFVTLGDFIVSTCALCAFYIASISIIRFEKQKNSASIKKEIERQKKLLTDELTEVYNRTALQNAFQHMDTDTSDTAYAFAMIDLDNFKQINDTLGHAKGDQCLEEFGRILRKHCADAARADAVPFRFGGDEFCIIFQNKTAEQIMEICKGIQSDLRQCEMNDVCNLLTASFGIAFRVEQMYSGRLLRNTDQALYRAKKTRDAICFHEDGEQG